MMAVSSHNGQRARIGSSTRYYGGDLPGSNGEHCFEPLLPAQLIHARQHSPELRLQLAVLECACDDLRRFRHARTKGGQELYSAARAWVASRDVSFGSFTATCEVLGIDPAYLRRGLLVDQRYGCGDKKRGGVT